jgi:Zn-dependent protease with chaperone function
MNAYTFGYHEPYAIVLNSGLVEKLNDAEIQAVIGHEMGHILFGHARIMSILGTQRGMGALLFYKWSRSCEYSADAAALLASEGDAIPFISSLLKLTSGLSDSIDFHTFLAQLNHSSSRKSASRYAQLLSTHPFVNSRIQNLLRLTHQQVLS